MKDHVAKVFIRAGDTYLFSIKNSPGKRKHGLLELLGGHLEKNESPFEALVREAREEEITGALATELERQRPDGDTIELRWKDQVTIHHIFHLTIDQTIAASFQHNPDESLEFKLIPAVVIDSKDHLAELIDQVTPRTKAIFSSLGLLP